VEVNEKGSLNPGLPAEVLNPKPAGDTDRGVSPQWTVGIGWYVYLYLNSADVNFLASVGFDVAAGILCGMLTATLAAGIVCGVGAAFVYEWIVKAYVNRWVPPGYCLELKFRNGLEGVKVIQRNC
jgi:hypothetical protein